MPDAELPEVVKQPKEISEPHNQNDDYQAIQDRFDLPLHRNESVYEPQHNSYCDNCEDDRGKWHFKLSNLILGRVHSQDIGEKLQAFGLNCLRASYSASLGRLHM